jgi:hypothetical protein
MKSKNEEYRVLLKSNNIRLEEDQVVESTFVTGGSEDPN